MARAGHGTCGRRYLPSTRVVCSLVCKGMAIADAVARRACALYALLRAGMALVDAVTCRACALYALLRAGMALADAVARRVRALYALFCAQAWRLRRRRAPRICFVCPFARKGMAIADAVARRECALYALLRAGMAIADAVARRACALYALLCAQAWRLLTPSRAGYALCMPSCTQRQGACGRRCLPGTHFVCPLARRHSACGHPPIHSCS